MFSLERLLIIFPLICISHVCKSEIEIKTLSQTNCYTIKQISHDTSYVSVFNEFLFSDQINDLSITLSSYEICKVSINSTHPIIFSIAPDDDISSGQFYLENAHSIDNECPKQLATHRDRLQTCYFVLQGVFKLHLTGTININITASDIEEDSATCLASTLSKSNEWSVCEFGVYDKVIECVNSSLRCDIQCPSNCSCILGDHRVIYSCLSDNGLVRNKSVAFIFFGNVGVLNMRSNGLTAVTNNSIIPINMITTLLRIDLSLNSLATLPEAAFNGLNRLWWLDYSNRLKVLPEGAFQGLQRLLVLNLHKNHLESLPVGLLHHLKWLEALLLSRNSIESLATTQFDGLYNLYRISLPNNQLSHIEQGTFANLAALEWLDISNNRLTSLPVYIFRDSPNLQILGLSENNLTQIPKVGNITNYIDLRGNPLTYVTGKDFNGISKTVNVIADQPVVCICFLNNSDNCSSTNEKSQYLTCDKLLPMSALSIFAWTIGLCAVFSNGFFLVWRYIVQRQNNVQNLLLSNLAVSDFLMGIYMIIIASADVYYGEYFPMNTEHWRFGVTCKIASMLVITSSEASIFFVTLISIDRFVNIRFPYTIHKLGTMSTRWASYVIWCVSISLALIATLLSGKNLKFYDNSNVCIGLPIMQVTSFDTELTTTDFIDINARHDLVEILELDPHYEYDLDMIYVQAKKTTDIHTNPGQYYAVAIFIGLTMMCSLIILACSIVIITTALKTSKEASREAKKEIAEEILLTVKVSALVLTDFCCWFSIGLIGALVQAGIVTVSPSTFAWIVTFILPINSSINPLMYTLGSLIGEKCTKKPPNSKHIQMEDQAYTQISNK